MEATMPEVMETPALAERRPGPFKRLYRWVLHWAETPYGTPALFLISFAESSFFPIPPDVLQIALSISRPRRSFYYAAVSTVASVFGGILGWAIGFGLWAMLAPFFFDYVPGFSQENFTRVQELYQTNAFLAVFTAAFTPIPYKVFTIAGGVFEISLPMLIGASILGRGGRFFLVGASIFLFGPRIKALLDKYLELATLVICILLVAGFVLVKYCLP